MVARSVPLPVPTLTLPDENATLALGAALAPHMAPGLVLTLRGELGAGKTTLVRGLLRALGHAGRVKSPTYALVEVYEVSRLSLISLLILSVPRPIRMDRRGLGTSSTGGTSA